MANTFLERAQASSARVMEQLSQQSASTHQQLVQIVRHTSHTGCYPTFQQIVSYLSVETSTV